jgi:hypothetical protein
LSPDESDRISAPQTTPSPGVHRGFFSGRVAACCKGNKTSSLGVLCWRRSSLGERPCPMPDRSRVSADQDYEVRQLAEKHGLSPTQIRELIARVGNDRGKLEEEAKKLRRS